MRRVNPWKSALSVGGILALYHTCWSTLVGLGVAGTVLDFVLRLHFMKISYELMPFDATTALGLVALTFVIGATIGLLFAWIWNGLSYRGAEPFGPAKGLRV